MKTYDLLVRLPITNPLSPDGFRSTDLEFQHKIDHLCDALFESAYTQTTRPAYVSGPLTADQIADIITGSRSAPQL
jgi:hypothetical protein